MAFRELAIGPFFVQRPPSRARLWGKRIQDERRVDSSSNWLVITVLCCIFLMVRLPSPFPISRTPPSIPTFIRKIVDDIVKMKES
jgi:hypothetical protein